MDSQIAGALGLETQPVALIWAEEAPEGATQLAPGRWGCVVNLFASAATKGRVAAFDRETFGCWGAGVGLGFGDQYVNFPGGMDCFCRFLSDGNEKSEEGRAIGEQMAAGPGARLADDFLKGERYVKTPEMVREFVELMPIRDIPAQFVVVKPLDQVDPESDDVKNVTFFVDPDRLSALTILANYARPGVENVSIPWAAACQVMGLFAYRELDSRLPRALVGLTDISARKNVRPSLGEHAMSFTAPWPLFEEMESNVEGSFLQRETWRALRQ